MSDRRRGLRENKKPDVAESKGERAWRKNETQDLESLGRKLSVRKGRVAGPSCALYTRPGSEAEQRHSRREGKMGCGYNLREKSRGEATWSPGA